jgi:hypothetical protein
VAFTPSNARPALMVVSRSNLRFSCRNKAATTQNQQHALHAYLLPVANLEPRFPSFGLSIQPTRMYAP